MTYETTVAKGVVLTRAVLVDISAEANDDRLVKLSFSSEDAVLRHYYDGPGWEVLGHGPDEVDMTRLATGSVPLLKDHRKDLDSMVGTVERAWIEGGKGRALVRFARTAAGSEMLARVKDGEVKSVSVGYEILSDTPAGERDGLPIHRHKWMPYEISLVAVPQDVTVGVGRSFQPANTPHNPRKERDMPSPTMPENTGETSSLSVTEERKRASEINALGRHFEIDPKIVADAISDGTTVDKFRSFVLDHLDSQNGASTGATRSLGVLHRSKVRPYSLTRAAEAQFSGDWSNAGFERDCSEELARMAGRAATGVYVPAVALSGQRDLLTTANAGAMIGTDHMGSAFIDSLKPEVKVLQLGARAMNGLRGNVSIPRMPVGTSAEWIAEDSAATESAPTFDNVTLNLRKVSARTRISRRQMKQSDPAIDAILQSDLRAQIAIALDRAAINGAGSALEPLGILSTPGIGTLPVDGEDGRVLTWAHITQLMAQVEDANAPMQSLGFLSNAKVKAGLLSTPKFPSGDSPILETSGSDLIMAGARAAFTSLVPSNFTLGSGTGLSALIFGAWQELLIGQFGGMDLIADPYTQSAEGNVRLTIHAEFDIALRNAESFAAITDIIA